MSKLSDPRQYKSFPFRVKAIDDEQGLIEAYGSVFNNTDLGDDIVRPGAFKRTIQNSKSRVQAKKATFLAVMLWNHDSACPIGGWSELKEDSHGLLCKGQIILGTQAGKEAYELIKAGVIQEFSIGYEIVPGGSHYDDKGNRNLTELRLWEVSPVTFAMNQEALLVGVKTAQKDKPVTKEQKKQLKTLMEHYNETQAEDLLEDWQDVFVCSLTCALYDAFTIGDSPQSDVSEALDAFKELVMSKFVTQAMECDLSGYLEENTSTYTYNSAASTLQNGSSDGYGYMSRANRLLERKAGKPISAANQSNIDDHVANVHALANEASKSMKSSMKALHDAADAFASKMQGNQADSDNPDDEQDDQTEKSYLSALRELKALRA